MFNLREKIFQNKSDGIRPKRIVEDGNGEQSKNEKEIMPQDFTSFAITLWGIWIHKNKVVFDGVTPDPMAVIEAASEFKTVHYKYQQEVCLPTQRNTLVILDLLIKTWHSIHENLNHDNGVARRLMINSPCDGYTT